MDHRAEPKRRRTRVFTAKEKAHLSHERFRHLDLDQVDFSGAILAGCIFQGVSLRGADFSYACLADAAFVRCDLRGAVFDHCRRDRLLLVECAIDEGTSLSMAGRPGAPAGPSLGWHARVPRRGPRLA